MRSLFSCFLLFFSPLPLVAQPAAVWVRADGAMFEATVQKVVPGTVTFVLKDGREQSMEVGALSERSRAQLAEALGLGSVAAPAAAPNAPAPAAAPSPAPAPAAMAAAPAAGGEIIDVTDEAQIAAKMGSEATLEGVVERVATLGATGHKLLDFSGTTFNFFISKQAIDRSADWVIDDLEGKRVRVTGKLETYRDAPQIRGNDPSQLTRLE
jgi:hypothetical protein